MKNSKIEWIGVIPEDWELIKIGSIFRCRNEKVNDTDYSPLSVTRNGIMPQMENVAKTDANDNRKMVKVNDFVINSRSDRKQSCGVSNLDGSVSLINTVLYTENTDIILSEYTNLLMKNYGFAEEFYRWGHGIVADLWTTRWQEMKSIVLPLPNTKQQEKIVRFVQKKIGGIDNLIAHEQATIEELKAYKQSVITEAVTKGLDKSVPIKDSGVEWIGEIPSNWSVSQIKRITKFNDTVDYSNYDIISYTPMECVGRGTLQLKEIAIKNISSGLTTYKEGDILMAKVTPCFENGNIAIAIGLLNGLGVGSSELFTFTPLKVKTRWLFYFLQNAKFKSEATATMAGTGGLKRVSPQFVKDYFLALPPEDEQQRISNYLDKKCADIDKLISVKQQKIEELKEYKKSLIYEYITGKKEVI